MVNTELLGKRVTDSGLKLSFIAEKMGISRLTLYRKLRSQRVFTVDEVNDLCRILAITDLGEKERIFFASEVEK